MKPFMCLQAFVACLILPVVSLAMEPLPLTELASTNVAIGTPLKGLLDDYVKLLPGQSSLTMVEPEQGFLSHSWSKNYDTLSKACQAQPAACTTVLMAQFDTLLGELNKADPKSALDLRRVLLMSAVCDLCQIAKDRSYRCNSPNLLTHVSIGWRTLGYEQRFLAYQDMDLAYRNQWSSWVATQGNLSPKEKEAALKRVERDKGAFERDAYTFELRDKLSAGYSSWLMTLLQQSLQPNEQGMLVAVANLARLAALQGQNARAEQWWQLTQMLLDERPELKSTNQCLLQSQRFSIDAAQASLAGASFDGPQLVQNLVDKNCPFTAQTLQFALRSLRQQQPIPALDALKRAHAACEQDEGCGYDRKQQINMLIAILQGQPASLRGEMQQWQGRIKRGELLSTERQIVWVLADRLHDTGAGAEAASLYQALDELVEFDRNQVMFNNPADLAAYDDLKRMRVRSDLEQGNQTMPMQTETLRGQGLLRRLRTQRWMKELADVSDAEAKAELERQLQSARTLRQDMERLLPGALPLVKTIFQGMLADMEGFEDAQQEIYLNKLAAKKLGVGYLSGWGGLGAYADKESRDSMFDSKAVPLDGNESYLSWLRVPGGYVGTLLAANPRVPGHYLWGAHNTIRQLFIPFSAQDEAMLQMYRNLLQSGATISRGAKRTSAIESDDAGLMLKGLPVWQQADGGFIASQAAPPGGKRVKNFGSLSDALFGRLLAPFAEHYQDAQRLIISPDGALSYLPFETLTRQGVSILETIDIGYVQSLAVYAELKKRGSAGKAKPAPALLSVADPQYASISAAEDTASNPQSSLAEIRWPSLPGTRKESAAITSLFRNNQQLLGAKASKSSLAEMQNRSALKGFRILHFATHGYVDDARSALVLSPEKDPVSAYLMDRDIVSWDLDSDLVLLSACNTGVGRQQTGEGIVGLPYAFFMAGNINTLMSLWPVDDEGTAKLMPAFMQRIQNGEDHIAALNNTKRAFARGDYGLALSNPRVWSAFVLYGVPLGKDTAVVKR